MQHQRHSPILLIRRVAEVSRNTFSFCDVICDENPDRTATIRARSEPYVGFRVVPLPRFDPEYHITAVASVVNRLVACRSFFRVYPRILGAHAAEFQNRSHWSAWWQQIGAAIERAFL